MQDSKEPITQANPKQEGKYPDIKLALYCFGILITGVFLGITIALSVFPNLQKGGPETIQERKTAQNELPPSFARAVDIASVSIVNVDAATPNYQPEQRSFGKEQKLKPLPLSSQGGGIIIGADGYILTCSHVAPEGNLIRVTTKDKKEFPAKIVGKDSYTDLAVIKIEAQNLPVAKMADIKSLKPGDPCVAIGSPYGFDQSISSGVISALDRNLHLDHHVNYIQTDAGVGSGNSGGALVNANGEVVGVLAKAVLANRRIQLAVPIDLATSVAKNLIENKKISRPFLGIYFEDILANPKAAHTLNNNPVSVIVGKLVPASPAAASGIIPGDTIKEADDRKVNSAQEVRDILKNKKAGDTLKLKLERNKQNLTRLIHLQEYPANL
ncbi:MAG: trypsin-like peptidase domain-containing protein [Cyanobacteria bacterium TGS_CYA1]|nr:trypsin-like peptidase domain-containing protein [Cyanobacteria bacterium TGS_CYA1]